MILFQIGAFDGQVLTMIDWTRVTELRDEIGIDDFDEVVEIFLEEVEEELIKLDTPQDAPSLEAILHLLKGCALNLGFREFSTLCQKGETAAASGAADSIDLPAVGASYRASKSAFLDGFAKLDAA